MLTAAESTDLARLEGVINRGKVPLQQLASAVLEIRDRRLYRAEFATFDLYCRRRLGVVGKHGGRIVAAARVWQICKALDLPGPKTFRQAEKASKLINAGSKSTGDEAAKYLARLKNVLAGKPDPLDSDERPSHANPETKVNRHLQELKRLAALHPYAEKAAQLLDYYASTVFPWPR